MPEYKYEATPDPYCYPGAKVLINKIGITDAKNLSIAERDITARRLQMLYTQGMRGSTVLLI
jgi:fido (protein-threonine AMPylation protein)